MVPIYIYDEDFDFIDETILMEKADAMISDFESYNPADDLTFADVVHFLVCYYNTKVD